ncbi:MAG: aminopeptidase P family protein [Ignavibacteriae bacterium]|nr:aminopeptidase P family protein [Ignavibacteriota bacterium]
MAHYRIVRLREEMRKKSLNALIVSSPQSVRYLTSFSGSNALCIITPSRALFFTDSRYGLQSKQEVKGMSRAITRRGLFEEVAEREILAGHRRVGFESHHITYAQYRSLRKLFPGTAFVSTADFVEGIALVKDRREISIIREAVRISDKVFKEALHTIRAGVSELDVAAEIAYFHKKFGAEGEAFEAIVASGERGSLPHARATSKRIKSGEFVTLDFGCTLKGYNSDITRTIAVGKPSQRAREIYSVVLDAQRKAIASARGGMWAKDLDDVARRSIKRGGYGRYFTHSLGHGLGLNVHERPRVSALSKERLQAGSVITIEPGVYVPGFGGVRIEDDVLLTEHGCEVLNTAPKELLIV